MSPPSRYGAGMASDQPSDNPERTLEQLRQQIRRIQTGQPDSAENTGTQKMTPNRPGRLRRSAGLKRRTPLRRQHRLG